MGSIFIGNIHSIQRKNLLEENEIKSVISILTEKNLERIELNKSINHYKIACDDTEQSDIIKNFDKSSEYIKKF